MIRLLFIILSLLALSTCNDPKYADIRGTLLSVTNDAAPCYNHTITILPEDPNKPPQAFVVSDVTTLKPYIGKMVDIQYEPSPGGICDIGTIESVKEI